MEIKPCDVLIVGAGLSGLHTAWRLQQRGLNTLVLEARERPGGRIETRLDEHGTAAEMGATWLGDQHRSLKALLQELNLPVYEQYMKGTSFFQAFSMAPPQPIALPEQSPSMRICGGTSVLIHALEAQLSPGTIRYRNQVRSIRKTDAGAEVWGFTPNGSKETGQLLGRARVVLICLPPQLAVRTMTFDPELPLPFTSIAGQTHTWMQDSIKVALTFQRPFWRENAWSGTLFSNVGPITEFYDHCDHEMKQFALCGFMDPGYRSLERDRRKEMVLEQLLKVFGAEVLEYRDYLEAVWAKDPLTSAYPPAEVYPHQYSGHPVYGEDLWDGTLYFSGSETAAQFGGYMEGAVNASNAVLQRLSGMIS